MIKKMRNKTKIKRRTENKLMLIGIVSLAVILMVIAGIAIAQSSSLENELAQLESGLIRGGRR